MSQVYSYLSPNLFGFYQVVTDFLSRTLELEMCLEQSQCDALDDPNFLTGHLDIAFICGLPFIRHEQANAGQYTVLAAPVMQHPRYEGHPIYFTDLIVRADSPYTRWDDLAGSRFCYNDLGSNSGYNLLRYWMVQAGYTNGFFGATLPSGSHQHSIEWVVAGQADCATIDSVVLEQAIRTTPSLENQIRRIEAIGPSPMPPIITATRLGEAMLQKIQTALLNPDAELQSAMQQVGTAHYAAVSLDHYAPLWEMVKAAEASNFLTIR